LTLCLLRYRTWTTLKWPSIRATSTYFQVGYHTIGVACLTRDFFGLDLPQPLDSINIQCYTTLEEVPYRQVKGTPMGWGAFSTVYKAVKGNCLGTKDTFKAIKEIRFSNLKGKEKILRLPTLIHVHFIPGISHETTSHG
jgi:hypothetical protein